MADDKKKDKADTSSTSASPGPVVNQLDDKARETFATGRPLEDVPDSQQCKHCKKSLLKTAMKTHVIACLKAKKEKLQRKKEAKEAREREKKAVGRDEDKDEDGDTKMEDSGDEDDASPEKKGAGGIKSAKKSAGKKLDFENKGKKRKAEGDAEKGPKQKKKKEEPKAKMPKQKGKYCSFCLLVVSIVPGRIFSSAGPENRTVSMSLEDREVNVGEVKVHLNSWEFTNLPRLRRTQASSM